MQSLQIALNRTNPKRKRGRPSLTLRVSVVRDAVILCLRSPRSPIEYSAKSTGPRVGAFPLRTPEGQQWLTPNKNRHAKELMMKTCVMNWTASISCLLGLVAAANAQLTAPSTLNQHAKAASAKTAVATPRVGRLTPPVKVPTAARIPASTKTTYLANGLTPPSTLNLRPGKAYRDQGLTPPWTIGLHPGTAARVPVPPAKSSNVVPSRSNLRAIPSNSSTYLYMSQSPNGSRSIYDRKFYFDASKNLVYDFNTKHWLQGTWSQRPQGLWDFSTTITHGGMQFPVTYHLHK